MKTTLEIEPVIDEPTEEVEDSSSVATTASSNKNLSVVEALRASFCKPAKYVLNCQNMTDEDWHALYPPNVKEIASLPGSGLPEWHYQWNYCTSCHATLRSCGNNPFGFKGAIGRARMEASIRRSIERATPQPTQITTEVIDEVTGEITTITTETAPKTRAAHGTFKQIMPPDNQQEVRNKYLAGGTINGLSEEFLIAAKAIRDFLAEEGILRKQGQKLFKAEPKAVAVKVAVTSEQPAARRGRERSTLFVTDELVRKVAKMLAKGVGGGMVAIAKAENVNPSELSVALKAAGVVITKGAKKGNFGSRRTA